MSILELQSGFVTPNEKDKDEWAIDLPIDLKL